MKIWIQNNIFLVMWTCFFVTLPQRSLACSAFSASIGSDTSSVALAANYDWSIQGGFISTQPMGVAKVAFLPHPNKCLTRLDFNSESPAIWVSKFASATLTQWGQEFPVQGINTQGLSGVVLNSNADYPNHPGLPSITELQWLQYQLDNFETISEVVHHMHDLNIKKLSGALHYYFCDSKSDCALIEFIDGTAVAHATSSNLDVAAITNSSYETSKSFLSNFDNVEFSKLPQNYDSLNRFVRAAWWAKKRFNSFESVFDGLTNLSDPRMTRWMTIFRPTTAEIQIKLLGSDRIYKLGSDEFKGHCQNSVPKMKVISDSNIGKWQPIDKRKILNIITKASYGVAGYNSVIIKELVNYPDSLRCDPTF